MLHPKLKEIKEIRGLIKEMDAREKIHSFTLLEKYAIFATEKIGSMGFFIIIAVWSLGWILWNVAAPVGLRFDPFPAFALWLFISNLIQILLMPLLMVGQNLLNKYAENRSKADFAVNRAAEKEIELVIEYLERILDKMEKK